MVENTARPKGLLPTQKLGTATVHVQLLQD